MRTVGPILYFRGQAGDRWRLAALTVEEGDGAPAPLETPDGRSAAPERLAAWRDRTVWRYDFSLPLGPVAGEAAYGIAGEAWSVALPAARGGRRLAYAACNGSEDEGTVPSSEGSRNVLWRMLAAEHARRPFHLLLQGGDQLYADTIWREVEPLGAWRRLPWKRGNAHPFTAGMREGAARYYFESYCHLWSQAELAPILAAVPSVMMWDDHDIFDGWGSWPEDRQGCAVFRGLGAAAREHFALFQLAARADRLPDGFADPGGGHFGCAFRAGDVGIVAPDLRSERSRERIMGEPGRRALAAALGGMAGCRHVVLMSSVPLTHVELPWLEWFYTTIPGHSDLEDDLRDQWQSRAHRGEWRDVLALLTDASARSGARITALSGEIHLGALGAIERVGTRIHELTASGIVHPPPPRVLVAWLRWLARRDTALAPDLRIRRLAVPRVGSRYLRVRNWLELELSDDGGLEAVWHPERGDVGRLTLTGSGSASPPV